jgi:hypothetical protein
MNLRALFVPFPLLLATLPSAPLSAQGGRVEVPPGREFAERKLLTPGLTDRWEVDAKAGEFLHCVVEAGSFDPVLELVDAAGESYGRDDGAGTRSELRLFAPQDGKFAFRVQGYQGRGGGAYSFWLLRYRTEPLPLAPAPERTAAEHVFGPERWWHFRIAVQAGDVIVPRVPVGGLLTAVLDAGQQRLPEWHGGYTAVGAGDVLLRVEGNEKERCRVDVQRARQLVLAGDGALAGAIGEGGMDVVRHHLAPGAYTLELDAPDGDVVEGLRETNPGERPRCRLLGALDKNGHLVQWYLVDEAMDAELVLRNHGGPRRYQGRLVPLERPVAFGAAVDDVLPLCGGRLFEFATRPGQLVRVAAQSEAFDARLDLWTPDGGVHGFDDGGPLDCNPQHTFLVRQQGVHRVLVFSAGGAGSGPFTLRVDDLPIPVLELGVPLPVELRGSEAFAHLALVKDQEVWLSLRSTQFVGALSVFGPDGRHVGTFAGGGAGSNVLTGLRAEQAGTFTIQVHARQGQGVGELRAVAP